MNYFRLIPVLIVFLPYCLAQNFYVALPNSLRLGTDESIAIAVDGTTSAQMVHVFIQDFPGKIKNVSEIKFTIQPGVPEIFKVHLSPNDFPGDFLTDSNIGNSVSLTVSSGSFQKEVTIPISLKSGYVFLHTDKPIYTPKQLVNFRIIPLGEDALPSNNDVRLVIKNPQNVVIEEKVLKRKFKVFLDHTYRFPTYPILGHWTATVFFGHKFRQNSTVVFELKEYVLPTFSVKLNTPDVILPTTQIISTSVEAKFVYGKKVKGTVTFRLGVKGESSHVVYFGVVGPKKLVDGTYRLNVNTSELKHDKNIGWFPGIEGSYFVIEATVLDAASGNKASAEDAKGQFSVSPFAISFQRCLQDFKPGLVSIIEADIKYVDGRPAANVSTLLTATVDGGKPLNITNPLAISDNEGKVSFEIHPEIQHNTITVTLNTTERRYGIHQGSKTHMQHKFSSKTNGYISITRRSGRTMKPTQRFSEIIYIKPAEISDIYYMVISKGKILKIAKLPHGQFFHQRIEFTVTYEMVPSFRIVVFALHGGEVIADSLKVDVEQVCDPKAEVSVTPRFELKEPGNPGSVIIEGTKSTSVGLLAVDEAVYVLSKRDLLTKSRMFKAFDSHDLGCGPGGGLTVNSVLRNAGVLIFTKDYTSSEGDNAVSSCEEKVRRKRSVISQKLSQYQGLPNQCCALGMSLDKFGRNCQERTDVMNRYLQGKLENCSRAFLDCCLHAKENGATNMKLSRQGSVQRLRSSHAPVQDIDFVPVEEENFDEKLMTVRSDFRETWFFENLNIGPDGREEFHASLPHSITTWVIQAVSVSPEHGMCVAQPQRVESFKKVFLQLNLPYSVVRNEQVEIQATVFNYGLKKISAIVYMYGVKDLCTGTQENEKSERKRLTIEANSAESTIFPVMPLKEGVFDLKVVVFTSDGNDIILRQLNVVPEGDPQEIPINIPLDPSNQQRRQRRHVKTDYYTDSIDETQNMQITTVSLKLPHDFVPGSESCTITALGDQFGPIVETALNNPEQLIRKPRGCGEQNMIFLGPTFYTMKYLKAAGKITPESEKNGYAYIRHGYGNQLSYRKEDGSYAAYQNKASSTWLTAFVMKVFCQANTLVHIDKHVMCSGVQWLVDQQQADGSYVESHPMYHTEMLGGVQGRTPMTAFVLITLQECQCEIQNLHVIRARAMAYLEEHLGEINEPLSTAIVTYALALSNSDLKEIANDRLMLLSKHDEGMNTLHWPTASSARDIETTSYALLTQLLFNDMTKSNSIVNWLNLQTLGSASSSTQDTVMALNAMSEYAIKAQTPGIDIVANITSNNDRHLQRTLQFHKGNAHVLQDVKIDKIGGMLFINTAGHGVGALSVKLRYNMPFSQDEICKFDVVINVTEKKEVRLNNNPANDVGGVDAFNLFPEDFIRGAEDALAAQPNVSEFLIDPRNRNQRSSRIAEIPSLRRQMDIQRVENVRVKRQNPAKNSNLVLKIHICLKHLGERATEMSIADVGIFTGFMADPEELEKLQEDPKELIQRYEISSKGVVFYLEKIPNDEQYCFQFHVTQKFIVGNTQTSVVKVYDYYNPDKTCTKFYSPSKNSPMLRKLCNGGICQCAEGGCPPNAPFAHLSSLATSDMTDKLEYIACEESDFVWLGSLAGELKRKDGFLRIPFRISNVIKAGIEAAKNVEGETKELLARDNCLSAELFPNNIYLIMGKDGQMYQDPETGADWYRYLLDKTTKIHLWTEIRKAKDRELQRALRNMRKNLEKKGCDS